MCWAKRASFSAHKFKYLQILGFRHCLLGCPQVFLSLICSILWMALLVWCLMCVVLILWDSLCEALSSLFCRRTDCHSKPPVHKYTPWGSMDRLELCVQLQAVILSRSWGCCWIHHGFSRRAMDGYEPFGKHRHRTQGGRVVLDVGQLEYMDLCLGLGEEPSQRFSEVLSSDWRAEGDIAVDICCCWSVNCWSRRKSAQGPFGQVKAVQIHSPWTLWVNLTASWSFLISVTGDPMRRGALLEARKIWLGI